jgi:hypothetical protein
MGICRCSLAQLDDLPPDLISVNQPSGLIRFAIGHFGQCVHPDVLQIVCEGAHRVGQVRGCPDIEATA